MIEWLIKTIKSGPLTNHFYCDTYPIRHHQILWGFFNSKFQLKYDEQQEAT